MSRPSRGGGNLRGCGFRGDFCGCGTKDWIPAGAGMTGWWGTMMPALQTEPVAQTKADQEQEDETENALGDHDGVDP